MKCESCNEREASIHISKGDGLEKSERFLCEQCANASFENDFSYPDDTFNIQKLLQSLSQQSALHQQQKKPLQCGTCGSTLNSIVQAGKFGCPDCYRTFEARLPDIVARVQANQTEHTGKIPEKSKEYLKAKRKMEQLKAKLQTLIDTQEFEEAAVIRDEIRDLEKAGEDGGV